MRKVVPGLFLVALVLVAVAPMSVAWDVRSGDRVVIGPDEVIHDDLYVSAARLTLEGRVEGDLVFVGQAAEIDGTVEGDLLAMGQSVYIGGQVDDDVRVLAQVVTLGTGAQVGDDLMALGFSLEARPKSSVGGGVLWGGYQASLAGEVAQRVRAGTGGLELRGSVGGDVVAEVGEPGEGVPFMLLMPGAPAVPSVPAGLTVNEGASVGGDLEYTCRSEVHVPVGVVKGRVVHNRPVVGSEEKEVPAGRRVLDWFVKHLRRLVSLVLVGLLMAWAVPSVLERTVAALHASPLPSLGWGALGVVAFILTMLAVVVVTTLVAVILGLVTLDGLMGVVISLGLASVSIVGMLFFFVVTYASKVVVGAWGGRMLLSRLRPGGSGRRIGSLVMGLVILVLLTSIPWIGGVIALLAALLGLGAVVQGGMAWQRE